MRQSMRRFLMVPFLAAAMVAVGCNTSVGLESDSGASMDVMIIDAPPPPDVVVADVIVVMTDSGPVCAPTCSPGYVCTMGGGCVPPCNPTCSGATPVCNVTTRICEAAPVDASVPDVQSADNGPACVQGERCDCGDPALVGSRICGVGFGCRCTDIRPDAGAPDAAPADSGPPACNLGETRCVSGGPCVNPQTDNANCGGCGRVCPSGQVCSASACVISCPAGITNCSGDCVNTGTNPANCGGCGVVCNLPNASAACTAGRCMVGTCRAGFADCDGNPMNGCEISAQTDVANCGACGTRCTFANASPMCTNGACAMGACNSGFADCDGNPANGCEVNLMTDAARCGSCGTNCGTGSICTAGACVLNCATGTTNCSGVCVDTRTSTANCGGCGRACPVRANTSMTCSASACMYACAPGFVAADGNPANGCAINTQIDVNNCGARGNACPGMAANGIVSCVAGVCRVACRDANFLDVDGLVANGCEVDVRSDRNNCGRQGNACTVGMTCCGGTCVSLDRDQYNCGACGTSCTAGGACISGYCTGTCRPSEQVCRIDGRTSCSDLTGDATNCGACGRSCSITNGYANCSSSTCGLTACYAGYGNCDGNLSNGCETNFYTSVSNCGGCGRACPSGANSVPSCGYYGCGLTCTSGFADCDRVATTGCEANLNTSATNCGWCGNACRTGETCDGGSCVPTCTAPRVACGSSCVDQRTDPNNCGGCFNTCATGLNMATACVTRTCRYTCSSGFADCDGDIWTGCETSVTTTTNCGACGNRCGTGQTCVAGSCACPTGQTLCGGACSNTLTDLNNCGACGRACPSGASCVAGTCAVVTPIDAGVSDAGVDAGSDSGTDVTTDAGTDAPLADAPIMMGGHTLFVQNGSGTNNPDAGITAGSPVVQACRPSLVLDTWDNSGTRLASSPGGALFTAITPGIANLKMICGALRVDLCAEARAGRGTAASILGSDAIIRVDGVSYALSNAPVVTDPIGGGCALGIAITEAPGTIPAGSMRVLPAP